MGIIIRLVAPTVIYFLHAWPRCIVHTEEFPLNELASETGPSSNEILLNQIMNF